LAKDESGATAIEYGLIVALIFLAIITSVQLFASNVTARFNEVDTAVTGVS
jgi:pilus assembly protein Flp/PilA